MSWFSLLPIAWRLGIIAGLLLTAVGGYYGWKHHVFKEGVTYERTKQQERNDEAIRDGRAIGAGVDACLDAGGVWDQSNNQCDR